MNDMSNEPISIGNPTSPLNIWRKALTQTSEQTFVEIASSPNARATTAYLWVFVASLIQIFLTALVQSQLYGNLAEQYGLGADVLGGSERRRFRADGCNLRSPHWSHRDNPIFCNRRFCRSMDCKNVRRQGHI